MSTKVIAEFRGEHAFLSNFYDCVVRYLGRVYWSAEAAYQAQKCANESDRDKMATLSPSAAKRFGRVVPIVVNWELVKIAIMEQVVRAKFKQNHFLAAKLIATGDAELIEGNHWGDVFWGVYRGKGENHLGKILMAERARLVREKVRLSQV